MRRLLLAFFILLCGALTASAQSNPTADTSPNQPVESTGDADQLLIKAIQSGDPGQVIKLLDAGANPNTTEEDESPLILAVGSNRADIAEILLNRGAKVDPKGADGGSALQMAATMGQAKLVKLMLAHGAKVNYQEDHDGHAPLLLAAFGAMFKGAPEWLARSVFEIDEDDKFLQKLGSEHLESAKLLIEAGANVNARGGDCGLTALMVAAIGGNVEMAKLLLDHHADPNLGDGDYTALKLAEEFGSPKALAEQLNEKQSDEDKQAWLNWVHFTAPGRKTVAAMLRNAGATH